MVDSKKQNSLRRSIHGLVLGYCAGQCAVFAAFAIPGGFFAEFWLRFILTTGLFHLAMHSLLIFFIDDFRLEANGTPLGSVNLANRITIVRMSSLPTLLYLVIAAKTYRIRWPLLVFVVLIFVTDFLDGYISRKSNEVTKMGRMADSASDYCLLIVLGLVFQYYGIIPIWLLALVLSRLGIQMVLMGILIFIKKKIEPKSTMMGKVAIASIMVVYSLEVLGLLVGGLPQALKLTGEALTGAILVAGIGDKLWIFVDSLLQKKDEG